MIQLDTTCCIFDKNESEQFQTFLEMFDSLAKPESDKSLPKINIDEYNEFQIYLKRIKIVTEELVSNNELYRIFVEELHYKQESSFFEVDNG